MELSLQPSARFNESVSWNRVVFDRAETTGATSTGSTCSTPRPRFQINREFALRAIVQYDTSQRGFFFKASYIHRF